MFTIQIRKKFIFIVLLLASLVVGIGWAAADGDSVFHACVNNSSGTIFMVAADDACKNNEARITWNQQGVPGQAGAQGEPGPRGVPGRQGSPGEPGPRGPQGERGPQGPSGTSGLAGQRCPAGESVYGFDRDGNILCSADGAPAPPPRPTPTPTATPPPEPSEGEADVILVVDSSGSMSDEVLAIQSALNGFAGTIEGSGLDLHLVLLGQPGDICISQPLGSGSCPDDENLPGFRHAAVAIGSGNAFAQTLSSFDQWDDSLRPDPSTQVIVVSDSDSTITSDQDFNGTWQEFTTQFGALAGAHTFHAIAADFDDTDFFDACAIANGGPGSERGAEYIELATFTGGVFVNLCDTDIATGLQQIAATVIASTTE